MFVSLSCDKIRNFLMTRVMMHTITSISVIIGQGV
jgi:hypothetical protein